MTPLNLQARRATLDDLPELRLLWASCGLAAETLEPRLTEFQVVDAGDGILRGCAGLHIAAQQGRLHSECMTATAPEIRELLWERMQAVAKNHGLLRLWVDSADPLWVSRGFLPENDGDHKGIPPSFGGGASWLHLKLRDDAASAISLEREFELFKQSQQDLSAKALQQARALKVVAWIVAIAALLLCIVFAVFSFKGFQLLRK